MSEQSDIGPDGLTDIQRALSRRAEREDPGVKRLVVMNHPGGLEPPAEPQRRRATQDELARAAAKYSTEAGQRQLKAEHARAFAEPLTEAELRTGGGYLPAITDIDCTPRPRYGEPQAAFLKRMASYGADAEALRREMRAKNREAALRQGTWPDGATYYFTACACKWHGLRVADPEVARREYDGHACAAESVAQAAIDRAQAHAGKATLPPRRAAVLEPALEQPVADEPALVPSKQDLDDLEQRVALLEPKT